MFVVQIHAGWEKSPAHMTQLDVRALLQDAAIPDVEMEEAAPEKEEDDDDDEEEEEDAEPVRLFCLLWQISPSLAGLLYTVVSSAAA